MSSEKVEPRDERRVQLPNERRVEPRNGSRNEHRVELRDDCRVKPRDGHQVEITVETEPRGEHRSLEVNVEVEPQTQAGTLYFDWFYLLLLSFYNGLFRLTHRMHGH